MGWVTGQVSVAAWKARSADLGALVEAERQMRSRDLVGAAMYVAQACVAPRAGVAAGLEKVEAGVSVGAGGAGVGEAGSFVIYLFTLLDPRRP